MSEFTNTLRSVGYLEATSRPSSSQAVRKSEGYFPVEYFIGKITSIFFPFIPKNISDAQFNKLQKDLTNVIQEIKEARKK